MNLILKQYNSGNRSVNVLGRKVKYCQYEAFSFLFNEIFINQSYLFKSEKKTPFIIDCGSNIGISILYFKALYPTAEIIAFEPEKDAFSCLAQNVEESKFNSVSINQKAVSAKEGKIAFYYDDENPGSLIASSIQDRIPKQKREVEAVRLSEYIDKDIDFLKMDIEGAELDVIEEVSDAGKLHYIKQMVIEYHHHIKKDDDVMSKILQLLENAGFGYQIESCILRPFQQKQFQDILIYAYQKKAQLN